MIGGIGRMHDDNAKLIQRTERNLLRLQVLQASQDAVG
jgi:hypothetical protein